MTKPLRVLIVDDEAPARRRIERFLTEAAGAFDVRQAEHGLAALALVESWSPDIVFLDIEMPELSGFDFLYQLKERPFKVIFQTAYDQFAVKAFDANACDYLLKPFTRERFREALSRVQDSIEVSARLAELERDLLSQNRYLQTLRVRHQGRYELIAVDEVDALVSRDHYTCLLTAEGEVLTKLSLDHLAERLDPRAFVRVHRAAIVRVAAVRSWTRAPRAELVTSHGYEIPVSRRAKKAFMSAATQSDSRA